MNPYGLSSDLSGVLAAYEGRQQNRIVNMMQQRQMERQDARAEEESIESKLERDRERYVMGARLLEGVVDNESYQAARQAAVRAGMDLTDAPSGYDPAYVEAVRRIGRAFSPQQREAQPTELQRNLEYLQQTNPQAAENYLRRQTEQAPLTINNGDGTMTIIPRATLPGMQSSSPQTGQANEQQLRSWADEAIRNGAPREAVEQRLQQMLQGGASQPGSQTFP